MMKPDSVVVRARHVIPADVADQLAAPRLQPLRTHRAKPRSIFAGPISCGNLRSRSRGSRGLGVCRRVSVSFNHHACVNLLHTMFHGGTVYSITAGNPGSMTVCGWLSPPLPEPARAPPRHHRPWGSHWQKVPVVVPDSAPKTLENRIGNAQLILPFTPLIFGRPPA